MKIAILLDHDLEGRQVFLDAALRETGWDKDLNIEFKRLRDLNLREASTDREIWYFVQREHVLLITSNRNRDHEDSLQFVIESESTATSLPVLTIADQNSLMISEYRQRVADKLAAVIIDLDAYLGTGRIYLP